MPFHPRLKPCPIVPVAGCHPPQVKLQKSLRRRRSGVRLIGSQFARQLLCCLPRRADFRDQSDGDATSGRQESKIRVEGKTVRGQTLTYGKRFGRGRRMRRGPMTIATTCKSTEKWFPAQQSRRFSASSFKFCLDTQFQFFSPPLSASFEKFLELSNNCP